MITGSWNGGALTMGSNAQTRVTLPVPNSAGLDAGFAGVLDTDMTWLGTDLLSGMLTFLGMNEGSGSEIYDDVNEATAVFHSNEPGRMAPDWDGAPVLSYAKGDHFRVTDNSIGEGVQQQLTLSARIFISGNQPPGVNLQSIVAKGLNNLSYSLYVSAYEGKWRLQLYANFGTVSGGVGTGGWFSTLLLDTGVWYDVAVIYDGNYVRFFVDGVPDTPIHSPGITFGALPNEPLVIGADYPGAVEYFDGSISRVGIFNRALNYAELRGLSDFSFPRLDASYTGLWIGEIEFNEVQEVRSGEWQPAPQPLFQRRIIHINNWGSPTLLAEATLMQTRVTAPQQPQTVVISDPARIADFDGITLRGGHRIGQRFSSTTSPMAAPAQALAVDLGAGESPHLITTTLSLPDDHPLNPFRHKYHPDLRRGIAVQRNVTIALPTGDSPADNTLTGTYSETVTGLHHGALRTRGTIILNRVSHSGVLNP